jgi:cation/acetate symporter
VEASLAGFMSAVAFATILAVVSGLLTAGASSAANDLAVGLSGRQLDERMRLLISQLAAIAIGVLRILLELACEGQNVAERTVASYRPSLSAPKGESSKPCGQRGC